MFGDQKVKNKYCWRFWPLFQQDYKWIASYLEERERKGYRLCSLGCVLPIARYQKVEPQEARYDVDVFRPKQYIKIQPYLDLCADSGWKIAWQWEEYKIFRAVDGERPVPLQSDWETKREQENGILKRNVRNSLLLFSYLCFLFFLVSKFWNWSGFYLDSYDRQYLTGMGIAVFIGSFCVLLNRLFEWYCFHNDEPMKKDFDPNDTLGERKKWATIFKIAMYFVMGSSWIAILFSFARDGIGWGIIVGGSIGALIGTAVRISFVESEWTGEQKMKGVHSKKFFIIGMVLFILFSVGGSFFIIANKESFSTANFYMKEIIRDEEFYSFKYGGSCIFEVKMQRDVEKMWERIDEEIRESEDVPMPTAESLKEEEIKKYGDYDTGLIYSQRGRVLLKKDRTICIMDVKP